MIQIMKISKGLKQAYDVQDFAFAAIEAFKAHLTDEDGKLKLTRDDASAIVSLVKGWEGCQERIRIHRRVPMPGSLKPECKPDKRKSRAPITPIAYAEPLPAPGETPLPAVPPALPGVPNA